MPRAPADVEDRLPADEDSISFAVLLVGGFLGLIGLILVAGIFGPMIDLGLGSDPVSPTPTQAPSLYSADAAEVSRVNESASMGPTEAAKTEHLIVAYANAERVDYKHTPLVRNPDLANISRVHSNDMVQRGFYDHYDPDGNGPGVRAEYADYQCPVLSENIAYIGFNRRAGNAYGKGFREFTSPRELAKALVGRWMKSGGHRWAILSPKYDVIGVGVYARGDDQVFATMMLCDRHNWPDDPPDGMDAPVADPGANYNESYWEPYPDSVDAPWDENHSTATPTTTETADRSPG